MLKLIKSFTYSFIPDGNLNLYESMCGFKCRIVKKLYTPFKQEKFEIKFYALWIRKLLKFWIKIVGEQECLKEMIKRMKSSYFWRFRIQNRQCLQLFWYFT